MAADRGQRRRWSALPVAVRDGLLAAHVSALLQKLSARDRVQLVVLAYDSGLVQQH